MFATLGLVVAGASTEVVLWLKQRCLQPYRFVGVSRRAKFIALTLATAIAFAATLAFSDGLRIRAVDDAEAATPDSDAIDTPFIVGDFWQVWPLVFGRRAQGADVFGITYRAVHTRDDVLARISNMEASGDAMLPLLCVGVDHDRCAAEFAAFTGLPYTVHEVVQTDPLMIRVER